MKGLSMKNNNFGAFIAQKRKEQQWTLRQLANLLDISAPYLSDVEKGRRHPFDIEKLKRLTQILKLNKEEETIMMDLAGQERSEVPPDLPEYILENEVVRVALRTARDQGVGEAEWKKFLKSLKEDS
jgi:transcriptional regulator with XRE-family HTH domain